MLDEALTSNDKQWSYVCIYVHIHGRTQAFSCPAGGCIVADGVWCIPGRAFMDHRCRHRGADGFIVADGVWCAPGMAVLEKLQRDFSIATAGVEALSLAYDGHW